MSPKSSKDGSFCFTFHEMLCWVLMSSNWSIINRIVKRETNETFKQVMFDSTRDLEAVKLVWLSSIVSKQIIFFSHWTWMLIWRRNTRLLWRYDVYICSCTRVPVWKQIVFFCSAPRYSWIDDIRTVKTRSSPFCVLTVSDRLIDSRLAWLQFIPILLLLLLFLMF